MALRTQEAIKTYIERNSYQRERHLIYTGRQKFHCDGKTITAARIWWKIHNGEKPERSWLLKTCPEPNCIDVDCWELSKAPAVFKRYYGSAATTATELPPSGLDEARQSLVAMQSAHAEHCAALDAHGDALKSLRVQHAKQRDALKALESAIKRIGSSNAT